MGFDAVTVIFSGIFFFLGYVAHALAGWLVLREQEDDDE